MKRQIPVGGTRLRTRTQDRYAKAGLPESMVNTRSGQPPEATKDRI